jgi:hypothetical protein
VGPVESWWPIGIYAATWVTLTVVRMKHTERRRLFTYFVHQGYTENAADEGAAAILSIQRFAQRKQPKLDKDRQEYERLRKKFEPDSAG